MGTVRNLIERLGFVRLRDFGLILTSEGRVLTTRVVLDDGYGGRIVGYRDDDLAATELVPPGAKPPAAPPPLPRIEAVATPPVAAPAEPEEDEWEWEIAAARARASAANEQRVVADPPRAPVATRAPVALATADPEGWEVPRTVVPVPAMPRIDPRLVKSYEPPRRYPRATAEHATPGAVPTIPSVRRTR